MLDDFWRLEHLGIAPYELIHPTKDPNLLENTFLKTVTQTETGIYNTILNVDESKLASLSDNVTVAYRQWVALLKRLRKDPCLRSQYGEEINGFINAGFAEKLAPNEIPRYFLPHFPVINPFKQTFAVRPVFNASSHAKGKMSLNDCIHDAPNLLPTPFDSILLFRVNAIALTGDISKAYLHVGIHERFRNFLCFFWDPRLDTPSGEPSVYRMKVNTFGVKDAQFNTISVIRHHSKKYQHTKPAAVHALLNHLYMDDLLSETRDQKSALKL